MGRIGNVFDSSQIDKAIELGEYTLWIKYQLMNTLHSVGVDVGFGSSGTAVVLTEFLKEEGKIRVLYAEEFEYGNPAKEVFSWFCIYDRRLINK